ncbi:MAG TPA: glycosyltransferase [Candidatus Acidoferrales bacterium]|nr:glycosyltransferase [Candidatus Acidoferrales bacterium]
MKRVLFVQSSFQPPSGGHGVAAWMVEALRSDHRISLLTWDRPDFTAVDRFFGTNLSQGNFRLYSAPAIVRRTLGITPLRLGLLKHSYLTRRCRSLASDHDLIVTAGNEADFGRRGIQYIHFPRLDRTRSRTDPEWYARVASLVGLYHRLSARLAGLSLERMKDNYTLVNSQWTATHVRHLHGIDSRVLRPPVAGGFPNVSWDERQNGFVCVGRISPEKELDKVIDIIAGLRARGHQVSLHIVGTTDATAYCKHIRQRAQQHSGWIRLEENLSRDALTHLMATNRYGLHGMSHEHYGMVVAEMVRAGCIPFVPRGGGQVEIVGEDDRLLYSAPDEAIHKIEAVLRSPHAQSDLRLSLSKQAQELSTERFVEEWREIVQEYMAANAARRE